MLVMTHADQQKQVWNLYWDTTAAPINIHARPQCADPEIERDTIADSFDGGAPAAGWQARK
ncbi:MAG: hypothetical protein DLM57_01990 [Pseudonocardiales bacterium]|nr:MAG: hypothetical protein DLM57_01990 [Pseudonocardiales bacterium]